MTFKRTMVQSLSTSSIYIQYYHGSINRICSAINWTKINTSYCFSLLILNFNRWNFSCNLEAMCMGTFRGSLIQKKRTFNTGNCQQFSKGGLLFLFPPSKAFGPKMIFVTIICIYTTVCCSNKLSFHILLSQKLGLEGFLKIDTLCFELSHSIESSLRSLSTM